MNLAQMRWKWSDLQLQLISYRYHLASLLVVFALWSWLNGAHRGTAIQIAAQTITAGSKISKADLTVAWIDGVPVDKYLPVETNLSGQRTVRTINSGTPLLQSDLTGEGILDSRFTISLPLESGDTYPYPVGSKVHVWALGDELAQLISADGVVLGQSAEQVSGPRIVLSLPKTDEFKAVTAIAVRLAIVNN